MKKKKLLQTKLALVLITCISTVVLAQVIENILNPTTNLYEFQSGAPVSSAQINHNFEELYKKSVPKGAVLAFNLVQCPDNWIQANGENNTPDLRGVFIRGLNSFDDGSTTRSDGKQDPEGGSRVIKSYQGDVFKAHRHKSVDFGSKFSGNDIGLGGTAYIAHIESHNGTSKINLTSNEGSTETRPKNVALTFCVKE